MNYRNLVFLLAVICLDGCFGQTKLSSKYVKYVCLRSPYLTSDLIIYPDGRFAQTVHDKNGGVFSVQGTWERKNSAITFDRFLYLVDLDASTWNQAPTPVSFATGSISGSYIVFRDDVGFIFQSTN